MSNGPTQTTYQTNTSENKPSEMDSVRAFGVVLGPSLALDIFAALGTMAAVTGWLFRLREGLARPLRALAIPGAMWPWAYAFFIRPCHLRWGATGEETEKPLPGDDLVPDQAIESTRAITINAPAAEVWP